MTRASRAPRWPNRHVAPVLVVGVAVGTLGFIVVAPTPARAEALELSFGLTGGVVLPAFESTDPSAFALATWTTGAVGRIGVLDDLALELRFDMGLFSAAVETALPYHGQTIEGRLHFQALTAHPALGARYNLLGGYAFSPHLEASVGLLWARYTGQRLLDASGRAFDLTIPNEGSATLTGGLAAVLEYRLLDVVLVSLRGSIVEALTTSRYRRHVAITMGVDFPWFP